VQSREKTMDPRLNHRHAQIHSAELHRGAELHRLAAKARATERGTRQNSRSRLHLGGVAQAIFTSLAHVGSAARGIPKLGSRADRT
jgi:hypothetical protein